VQFRRPNKPAVAINIAPLVDVVFLLVIFFAVSTTFLETAGLKLELPKSRSTAPQEVQDLTVFLGADGQVSFDGEAVERDALAGLLGAELDLRESKNVVLQADAGSRHGDVVEIMDIIQESGAEKMKIAARPGDQ